MTVKKKSQKQQHHFAHDQGLLRILILCWLASILAGLTLHKILQFFPNHDISSLIPTFSYSSTSGEGSDASWKHVEFHGDVELLRRPMALVLEEYSPYFSAKATGLYAYRAVSTVDLPIEALLHVFRDTPNNVDWVKDLKEAEEYHKSGTHHKEENVQVQTSIVRHRYNTPILGMSDREYVMHKKMTAIEQSDGTHSKVTYEFEPFDEKGDDLAMFSTSCFECVRGTKLSKWTFTSLDDGKKTKVELEVTVDPNIPSLSTFFINLYQKSWPHVSLHGLMRVARHHLHRDEEIQVTNVLSKLFPLKM